MHEINVAFQLPLVISEFDDEIESLVWETIAVFIRLKKLEHAEDNGAAIKGKNGPEQWKAAQAVQDEFEACVNGIKVDVVTNY